MSFVDLLRKNSLFQKCQNGIPKLKTRIEINAHMHARMNAHTQPDTHKHTPT